MTFILALAVAVFGSFFKGKRALALENLALRQQLAVYKRVQKRPRLRSTDRAFWVWLFRIWGGWKAPLILVRPETVIHWHHQGFKLYWRWRSRPKRLGRPTISREHIAFIMRMSRDNPSWGEDKINEELRVKFGRRKSEGPTASSTSKPPKSPPITHLAGYPNPISPIHSSDEAVFLSALVAPEEPFNTGLDRSWIRQSMSPT